MPTPPTLARYGRGFALSGAGRGRRRGRGRAPKSVPGCDVPRDRPDELLRVDGLHEVGGAAGGQQRAPVGLVVAAGEGDHGDVRDGGVGLDAAEDFEAGNVGEAEIEED